MCFQKELSVWATQLFSQKNNPFLKIQADSVVLYDFESQNKIVGDIVDADGNLSKNIITRRFFVLTREQIKEAIDIFTNPNSYGGTEGSCFMPHMGIVFYKSNAVIAHLTICLECNSIHSSVKIKKTKKMLVGGEKYIISLGINDKSFKRGKMFCKKLRLQHCKS